MSDSEAQPQITRTKVTYGRRPILADIDESNNPVQKPPIAEHDASEISGDEERNEPVFQFTWQKTLRDVDESDEDAPPHSSISMDEPVEEGLSFGTSSLASDPQHSIDAPPLTASSSRAQSDDEEMETSFNTDITRDTTASDGVLFTPPTSSPPAPELTNDKPGPSMSLPSTRNRTTSNKSSRHAKGKPLTKKQREETIRESARILAGM